MVEALRRGDIAGAPIDDRVKQLLSFVELLTKHAYKNTQQDIDQLREVGWSDDEIAEAVYITAMFAFFNRVADAFGLDSPNLDDYRAAEPQPNRSQEG